MSYLNGIIISGVNPSSYIDYPGEISYVLFLGGCNFRCPFCHNASIVNKNTEVIDLEMVIKQLKERTNFIKAVVVTGGEPTIYGEDLITLLSMIKELGFKIKLDTNGTNPSLVKKIIDNHMVDYIAMDIKNTFSKYEKTANSKVDVDKIKESIELIKSGDISYLFRTTINKTDHQLEDIREIISYVDNHNYVIQNYKYSKEQIDSFDFGAYSEAELDSLKENLDVELIV